MNVYISEQITLTPLTESDAAQVLLLVDTNRHNLNKYLYWVNDVHCIQSAAQYISDRVNSGFNGAHWFKINLNGVFCGVFAIKSVCVDSLIAEVGYWLCNSARKRGVINQIITKLSSSFVLEGAKLLEFRCLENNIASINIALKAGAELVDSISDFMVIDGMNQDLQVYRVSL